MRPESRRKRCRSSGVSALSLRSHLAGSLPQKPNSMSMSDGRASSISRSISRYLSSFRRSTSLAVCFRPFLAAGAPMTLRATDMHDCIM